jgi:hypothetical protein
MRITIHRIIPNTTKWNILFGGFLNQFGWSFFGFGLIFFWVFAMNADLSFLHFTGRIVTVEGIVTMSVNTGASENDVPVFENHATFTAESEEREVVSYSTGQAPGNGETVTIEYPAGKPQYARIKGMRRQIFGPVVLFVVIFPVIGLAFLFAGLKKSLRVIRLLQNGALATGKLISKVPTQTRINNQQVYKVTFRFKDHSGHEWDVTEKTHLPHLLEDEAEESLLYLPSDPRFATMLDALPRTPSINERGNIEALPLRTSLLPLMIPLLTIVGHGLYFYIRFMR